MYFNTIEIEKKTTIILKRIYYVSKCRAGYSKEDMFNSNFSSVTLEIMLEKLSCFLDCEIDERHYIIN